MRKVLGILALGFAAAMPIAPADAAPSSPDVTGALCNASAGVDPANSNNLIVTVSGGPVTPVAMLICTIQVGDTNSTAAGPDVAVFKANGSGGTATMPPASKVVPASPATGAVWLCPAIMAPDSSLWFYDNSSNTFVASPGAATCGRLICVAVVGCNDSGATICVAVIGCNDSGDLVCVAGIGCNDSPSWICVAGIGCNPAPARAERTSGARAPADVAPVAARSPSLRR